MIEHTLPEAFCLASGWGIWEPVYWQSSLAKKFYSFYTFVNVIIIFVLLTIQLIALFLLTENLNDFAEASYVFLAGFNGCVKGITLIFRRKRVAAMVNELLHENCTPRNVEEMKICSHYNKMARYTVLSYVTLVGMSSGATAILPCFLAPVKYALQLKAWYPYEITNDLIYWCTYVHQALGILIGAAWNATNDTIVAGFMMQTCAQLDLIICRLQQLPENTKAAFLRKVSENEIKKLEEKVVKESVLHHLQVFQFAKDLKNTFTPSIFIQFGLSLIIICVTIYELTAEDSNIPVSFMLIFLSSMLVELFLYCWFGNEVTLKSLEFSNAICKSDWTELRVETLKGLLIMMLRTTSPIYMNCGPFITLSLQSYVAILKLSYSAFNVLQSSSS